VIGCARCIRIVLADAQVGLVYVMQQTIEDIWRLAHCRRDYPCVERAVVAGDVRVDYEPWIDAVLGIDRTTRPSVTATSKVLAVR
jgi:hypothetical protein